MAETNYGEAFREEAVELLEEMETSLLELERAPDDATLVSRLFRTMHTIKGSGAMFGYDDIAAFTHHVETALDKVRGGTAVVSPDLINLILAAKDHIHGLLAAAFEGGEVSRSQGDEIVSSLARVVAPATGEPPAVPVAAEPVPAIDSVGPAEQYYIHFEPVPEFFEQGISFDDVLAGLHELGHIQVQSKTDLFPEAVEGTQPFWDILLTTDKGPDSIRDAFIFYESCARINYARVATAGSEEVEQKRLGEILVDRGDIKEENLKEVLKKQKPIGQLLVEEKLVEPAQVKSALAQQNIAKASQQAARFKGADSLRVAADKLDHLINLVGELVVTQARLTQISTRWVGTELTEPVEEIERLTADLRDSVLDIRMLPIGTTFTRFQRLVRDLSAELGKDVELVTEGAETELDKSVIDKLGDPLVHLIRNCMDHGIEGPKDRQAVGKPAKGRIMMAATHSGANVIITVTDDGQGLDADKIRAKAVEKGMIAADAAISLEEIFKLIFGAGVSTATKVTNVSGRGVGMDVVKTTIEGDLKGSVAVRSEKGKGTTVSISLPLTLAIIDGLLTKVGVTYYVLPLSSVEECVEMSGDDIMQFSGRRLFSVRGQLVPYVKLRDFFTEKGTAPGIQQMVIVRADGQRYGMVVDDVIGGHQTVIKSLGWAYRNAEGVSGATILGNGEVALIVDVIVLLKVAQSLEKDRIIH